MDARQLGRTDLELSPIGLGSWQFSQGVGMSGSFWPSIDQETITSVTGAALNGGISWFDTAEGHGRGRSEQTLAAALSALGVRPGSVVVATKWWPFLRTARSIGSTIGKRLAFLSPYPIDLYQVHQPWSFSPIPVQMREMAQLVRAKHIRAVGVSNFSARQMEEAHAALAAEGIPLASNQVRFNLLDRRIEENGVLDTARRLGVTVIAWSPLAQGMLTGRFHDDPGLASRLPRSRRFMNGITPARLAVTAPLIGTLKAIAKAHSVTPSQVALAWTVSFHGDVVVAIPGASKPAQAEQSAAAMRLRLSSREMADIDEASKRCAASG
ncbi:MAG: aldo/keto reductase [Spirochaetes bacterium]|nr:aldo/keto reductase [Spirochaetota bacterium]